MRRRRRLPFPFLRALSPWAIFLRTGLVCGLLSIIVIGLSLQRIEPLPLNHDPLVFDGQRAWSWMRTLSKDFPGRTTWSDARKRAAVWLKSEFKGMGYEPKGMNFSEVIAGKHYDDLENVYAEKRGKKHPDEIVVVMAHYDITDTTKEGAMDDASGVGVVLELARIFSKLETDRTILFLATDSEEFGAFWGARAFARQFDRADQIVGAASFDFVSPYDQTKILTLCDGLQHGFTPLWLRELALNSVRSASGIQALDLDGLIEYAVRALLIPPSDHGAFLKAGIPAFNWVGQNDAFGSVMARIHHTEEDVAEKLKPESFTSYGRAAERFVRSIDALPRIPENPRHSDYWKIGPTVYMGGLGVRILQILAFFPFLAFSGAKFGRIVRKRPRARILGVFKNEAKGIGILLGSLLLGYAILLLLPSLKIITQYEVFPATQKSSILYNPNFLAMILVGGAVLAVYTLFRRVFRDPQDSVGQVEIRQSLHAFFLAIIIAIGMVMNSFLASLFLIPPAYFWTAVRSRKGVESRLLNALFLLGGAVTLVGIAIAMSLIFHVGVFYWYVFLAVAYGLISTSAMIAFLMALTVMLRLFRHFVL